MENILSGKKILLGISGSIAAYKSPLLVREFIRRGAEVRVVMTPSAVKFVAPLALNNLTKYPVAVEMFDESIQSDGSWHVHLALWCDAMLIAPASATTIARLATGNCDTALASVALALPRRTPLVVAPAMDSDMWLHPATQRNVRQIEQDGALVIPPAHGELASGIIGVGRLPEIPELVEFIERSAFSGQAGMTDAAGSGGKQRITPEQNFARAEEKFEHFAQKIDTASSGSPAPDPQTPGRTDAPTPRPADASTPGPTDSSSNPLQDAVDKDAWNAEFELDRMKRERSGTADEKILSGRTVMITAGPTYEKIDDVRFVGNYSSGKMGFALAEAAQEQGAKVILISGPVALKTPEGVERIDVASAQQMYDAANLYFDRSDIAILSAAVADFTPEAAAEGKIKKADVGDTFSLKMKTTPDILKSLGARKKDSQLLVGFALESVNEVENGRKKLHEKNCDMIVVNSANKPQSGFQGDENTITILQRDGSEEAFPPMSKRMCADLIVQRAEKLIRKGS